MNSHQQRFLHSILWHRMLLTRRTLATPFYGAAPIKNTVEILIVHTVIMHISDNALGCDLES